MTSTTSQPPPKLEVDVYTSELRCPEQLIIDPGISVGPLHLGMSITEAGSAAHLLGIKPCCGSPKYQEAVYDEGGAAPYGYVYAWLYKKRIVAMVINNSQWFITTTGIMSTEADLTTGATVPGSTENAFLRSGGSGVCRTMKDGTHPCHYQHPKGRYTLAMTTHIECRRADSSPCPPFPRSDWYVGGLGVANKQGAALLRLG